MVTVTFEIDPVKFLTVWVEEPCAGPPLRLAGAVNAFPVHEYGDDPVQLPYECPATTAINVTHSQVRFRIFGNYPFLTVPTKPSIRLSIASKVESDNPKRIASS